MINIMEEDTNKAFDQKLGKTLSDKRRMCGLSQQDVADRMNVTKTAVSYWENGNRSMYAYTVNEYCKAIGIDISEIVTSMKKKMTTDEKIGHALQLERENAGLTLREMANRLKADNFTISKWETGKNKISVADLLKYLEILNVKAEDFFRRIENEE